ncbi:tripartite tricarboxylate transporter TctB family protein [Chelatococcus asaccharovorans]|uniref:Tripartite tricarboxylate transporter TctB family protein n=1 Tax=Chelatococcus asaccharovorans TaxID=28210 RepID=A0A2V3TU26_9HYPH|nr:tripartite tricarboxylate transporter TctB family protein [Chelatococcus asaccharovorans]MBS7705021.1 tripartite tricarboxylate transporter TctB family protein [Chelatococcus asaccharovorans]PXW51936.1 tripartite tricarboxylate transporter TctB family protein [Chelatococcus asaccharovorans]
MKISQDTALGTLFVAIGVAALLMALQYPMGTANRMGPGYFPLIVSALLSLIGAAIILRGRLGDAKLIEAIRWKPLAMVSAALVAFGLLIEGLGLPLAVFVLILGAALASDRFGWSGKATLGAAVFAGVCGLVFVRFLGLPIPMAGAWLKALGGF